METQIYYSTVFQAPVRSTTEADVAQKIKVRHSITIARPREQVYSFWRNLENLSLFFKDVESVEEKLPRTSHWKVRLKNGTVAEWDADIVQESRNNFISWSSKEDSKIQTTGTVVFEDGVKPNQSIVRVLMDYSVPGGKLTEWATFLAGENPDTLTIVNLKRLKAYLETGEIPTTEGQPSGRRED